jgi:hypothetical protein
MGKVFLCEFDLLKIKSMLLGDKKSHLRPVPATHPMHSKNIFDAVAAYRAESSVLAGVCVLVIKM